MQAITALLKHALPELTEGEVTSILALRCAAEDDTGAIHIPEEVLNDTCPAEDKKDIEEQFEIVHSARDRAERWRQELDERRGPVGKSGGIGVRLSKKTSVAAHPTKSTAYVRHFVRI